MTIPRATIRWIAHELGPAVVSQQSLEERFGSKEVQSILKMTGIRERRVVRPGQCASDLALDAASRLLAHSGVARESIDLLTFATQTPDYRIPATASVLHGRLGLSESCMTFDIGQACTSFLHSVAIAHSMIAAGTVKHALVLNGDALSTLIHPLDRGLVALHGDGASAALLSACDDSESGFEFFELGTDGTKFDKLLVPAGGARQPSTASSAVPVTDSAGCVRTAEHLYMDGPAVFHFCVYKVTDFLKGLLSRRGLSAADFDLVLLHQANRTMVDMIYKAIKVPPEKRCYFMEDIGNLSGASLPTLLSHAWQEGRIAPGSRTLLCAFGGGLSWGAASIRWPKDANAVVPTIPFEESSAPSGALTESAEGKPS